MSMNRGIARKIAKRILEENRKGRSWRVIAREDFPGIKPGTLNRFANAKGTWLPNESILIILGVPCKPKPIPRVIPEFEKRIRKKIAVMAKQTRVSLGLQK